MKNRWNDDHATACGGDPLALRVYSSRLIGQESSLVLHGGGNTSVKATYRDIFSDGHEVLFIKGSGWDLATIETAGFAPVSLEALKRLAALDSLRDSEMVRAQRLALLDPQAPNPSVEAILHALIPFQFVDHSHADAVVTLCNTPDGENEIRSLYGERILFIPYVMPGFDLANSVVSLSRDCDWEKLDGMVLMGHGLFTFANDAKTSYSQMIDLVSQAEERIEAKRGTKTATAADEENRGEIPNLLTLAKIRRDVSKIAGAPFIAKPLLSSSCHQFASQPNAAATATRGPLTPDHVTRTKRIPLIIDDKAENTVEDYLTDYQNYFQTYTDGLLVQLDPAPRWAIWPEVGAVAFAPSLKEAEVIADIVEHTLEAITAAETFGGWAPLPPKEIFDVEYWELQQAKLQKSKTTPLHQGKVVVVSGAASGIGLACAQLLLSEGAAVAALDINPEVENLFTGVNSIGLTCDLTKPDQVNRAVAATVGHFGGIDTVISNAGLFTPSSFIEELEDDHWNNSLEINLTSAMRLIRASIPFLQLGIDPSIIIIGSKNVPAPGPGAAAYSVAKAGLNQLARVATLELASKGIRVNTVHPNAVFDTAIWTDDVLQSRAQHYGLTVEEYKTSNLLKREVTSMDVAQMVSAMAGPIFSRTTGAQVPLDGGTERIV